MIDDILNTILKDTFSLTQLKHRLRILKSSLLKIFFGGGGENTSFSVQDLNWLKNLPESFYQKFNKDNVYQVLSELERKSAESPTLTMYLTFEPDDATLASLGTFVRNAFGLSLMLDIKFDPGLIAGTALVWKGVYRNYSLRAKIDEKKAEISENFKRFLR